MRCRDEALEERMRLVRLAAKLGMKLAADEEGMLRQLQDLNQLAVRGLPAEGMGGMRTFLVLPLNSVNLKEVESIIAK